jgi:hypothetical protein
MFRVWRIAEGSFQLQRDMHMAIGTAFASCWCAIGPDAPIKSARDGDKAKIAIFSLKLPENSPGSATGTSRTRQSGSRVPLWQPVIDSLRCAASVVAPFWCLSSLQVCLDG